MFGILRFKQFLRLCLLCLLYYVIHYLLCYVTCLLYYVIYYLLCYVVWLLFYMFVILYVCYGMLYVWYIMFFLFLDILFDMLAMFLLFISGTSSFCQTEDAAKLIYDRKKTTFLFLSFSSANHKARSG